MKNQEGIVRRQIGERIHQRRRELGLSAEALAKRLGVSKSTVGRYEQKGVSPERTGLLISLSEVLDTSFDWLVGGGPAEAGKSVTAYARELDEHIRRALTRIRRSGLEREQEELFVGTLGYFIDYFGVLAGHYGKAVRGAGRPREGRGRPGPPFPLPAGVGRPGRGTLPAGDAGAGRAA